MHKCKLFQIDYSVLCLATEILAKILTSKLSEFSSEFQSAKGKNFIPSSDLHLGSVLNYHIMEQQATVTYRLGKEHINYTYCHQDGVRSSYYHHQ